MKRAVAELIDIEESKDLEVVLAKREEEISKLLAQNRALVAQKDELEKVLKGVLESKSWKVTRPLRALTELSRKIFPLVKFHTTWFRPQSGRNATVEGAKVTITGPSANVMLSPIDDPVGAVHGWVLPTGRVKCKEQHSFFLFHYRTGTGFNEHERCGILFLNGKPSGQPFRLPTGIKEFRLDPFNIEESLDIEEFGLRHLGSLQLLLCILSHHGGNFWHNPRRAFGKAKKAWSLYREGGFTALRIKLFADQITNNYQEWVKQHDILSEKDEKLIKGHIGRFERKPLISILMPVWNTPEQWLEAAIESVRGQLYENWELCISDDASTAPHVRKVLERYEKLDPRIKVVFREQNGHISQATNSALQIATGDYVALLDHDDELTPHALYMVVSELEAHPDAGLIYSDEDKKTSYGMRFNPYFKSDWNPVLLLAQNYVCHFTVMRTDLVRKIGGFRDDVEGAQDWDLILRASREIPESQIRHIPHILYHWRVIEGSTAQSTAYKPYVMEAQKKSVEEHLAALGKKARVEILEGISQLRVSFEVPDPAPLVSLIIPTRDQVEYLRRCVGTILDKSSYRNFEIVIIDNNSTDGATNKYFRELGEDKRVKVIKDESPFNFSRINNNAVTHASGDILGFLNNDLEVISEEWLSEMVSYAMQPEVGAVGARLLYPSNLLQHGGIILGIGGVAGHNHKGQRRENPGYFNRAILPQNLSAVTAACLLMRRSVFNGINGFDESLSVAFNDVDLCLRIRQAGYTIVYTPYAELYHHESASRGYENTPEKFARFENEIVAMKKRWRPVLASDPYYNPNLTLLTEDFAFAFPPRAMKPWRQTS